MAFDTPAIIAAAGIFGGTAAVTVAGVAGATGVEGVPVNLLVGAGIASILGAAVVAALKVWVERQVTKFVEMPTKAEIFAAISAGVKRADEEHAAVMSGLGTVTRDVKELKDSVLTRYHAIDLRVAEIETRHETEDRLGRSKGA